jgi:hypothetical protein
LIHDVEECCNVDEREDGGRIFGITRGRTVNKARKEPG